MCNLVSAYAAEASADKKLDILRVIAGVLDASESDRQAVRDVGRLRAALVLLVPFRALYVSLSFRRRGFSPRVMFCLDRTMATLATRGAPPPPLIAGGCALRAGQRLFWLDPASDGP